jgi:hypothetical protein
MFKVDLPGIAAMLHGDLMPRPPILLASIIAVTFIGKGALPQKALRHLFPVCRRVLFEALLWFKENNGKYFGHINIDLQRLEMLPEDDVPIELLSIVQQSSDEGIILEENTGYVPEEMDTLQSGKNQCLYPINHCILKYNVLIF